MTDITIRRAVIGDTDAMVRITRNVWEGHDYLPFVWSSWLSDPNGYLMVATAGDRLVGLQHVALFDDRSAWIEGIRVAEDTQGTGVAGSMLRHALDWSASTGCNVARLATSSGNPASNRLALGAGMTQAQIYPSLGATASDIMEPRVLPVRTAPATDFAAIRGRIGDFLGDDRRGWRYTEGWTAHMLTDQRLRLLLATGAIAVAGEMEALAIATADVTRPNLKLGLLAGSESGMTALGRWLRTRAAAHGLSGVRAHVPVENGAVAALESAGYAARDDIHMILYELTLPA